MNGLSRSTRRRTSLVLLTAFGLSLIFATPEEASAWKVYTHVYIAKLVRDDVLDDGRVTINGEEYEVAPALVEALREYPEYYYAGVIGPDGFPEVVFGQSIIHPENTGAWMRHVYRSAWRAQYSPDYTAQEKAQILAFGYGYITHPAGDLWAHTLVNDFAQGVFPSVSELANSVEARSIVLRHQIMEGYLRSATPGFDGNPGRGAAPGGYSSDAFDPTVTTGSDVSDKSTPSLRFDAPHEFIYRTLIDPMADTPQDDRGVLIDSFLELKSFLEARVTVVPENSMETLLQSYNQAAARVGDALSEFESTLAKTGAVRDGLEDFLGSCDPLQNPAVANPVSEQAAMCGNNTAALVASLTDLGIASVFSASAALGSLAGDVQAALVDIEGTAQVGLENARAAGDLAYHALLSGYFQGWAAHIDDGLRNWSKLGLGISRGMFDAQTFRDAQNAKCQYAGLESTQNRINCEDGASKRDAIAHATSGFVEEYLIPMLGEPDGLVGLRTALGQMVAVVDTAVGVAGLPLNPIREGKAQVREAANELISFGINTAFGIDIDQLEEFATNISNWTSVEEEQVTFPGLGEHVVQFFSAGDHERLDRYMGLPADHHLSASDSRLADNARFDVDNFAALHNTKVMTALVLLGTDELNRMTGIGAYFDHSEGGYTFPANVLTDGLDGEPWLRNIDSDHAWRADRRPTATPNTQLAGTGKFPLWESCQTRDVFRRLFKDWEAPGNATLTAQAAGRRPVDRRRAGRVAAVIGPVNFPDRGDRCTETHFLVKQQAVVAVGSVLGGDVFRNVKQSGAEQVALDRSPEAAGTRLSDLTVELLGPRAVSPGQSLERGFKLLVKNGGAVAAPGARPSRGRTSRRGYSVEIFMTATLPSKGQLPRGRIRLERLDRTPPVQPNGAQSLTLSGRLPDKVALGRTFICAMVDPDGHVLEADEGNNMACVQAVFRDVRKPSPDPSSFDFGEDR